jgi:hypothetical protein
MKTASTPFTEASRSVEKNRRLSRRFFATSSARPGSKIGMISCSRRAILPASLSMQITVCPKSARQAPETRPTYPDPTTAMRITHSCSVFPRQRRGFEKIRIGPETNHPDQRPWAVQQ